MREFQVNMIKIHCMTFFQELKEKIKMLKRVVAVTISQKNLSHVDFHEAKEKQAQREDRQWKLPLAELVFS